MDISIIHTDLHAMSHGFQPGPDRPEVRPHFRYLMPAVLHTAEEEILTVYLSGVWPVGVASERRLNHANHLWKIKAYISTFCILSCVVLWEVCMVCFSFRPTWISQIQGLKEKNIKNIYVNIKYIKIASKDFSTLSFPWVLNQTRLTKTHPDLLWTRCWCTAKMLFNWTCHVFLEVPQMIKPLPPQTTWPSTSVLGETQKFSHIICMPI